MVASLELAENARHGGDRERGLVRAHDPGEPDGATLVSNLNQAAALRGCRVPLEAACSPDATGPVCPAQILPNRRDLPVGPLTCRP